MFKLVVVFALIAACSADLFVRDGDYHSMYHGGYHGDYIGNYRGDYHGDYHITVMPDHIIVTNKLDHQVHLVLDRYSGPQGQIYIQVLHKGQVLDRKHVINEPVTVTGKYEAEVLYQIFDNFRGTIDEVEFERLLHIVAQHVKEGHVHPVVFYTLQMLSHQPHSVQLLHPYHQQYYDAAHGMFHQGYNQESIYNKLGHWQGYGDYQRGYTGLGHYGNWYGVGTKGVHYPEVHGQDWTHVLQYGPYSSNVWNRYGQGYGHHYGYDYGVHKPYRGYWSQWQGGLHHQTQPLLN